MGRGTEVGWRNTTLKTLKRGTTPDLGTMMNVRKDCRCLIPDRELRSDDSNGQMIDGRERPEQDMLNDQRL